MSSARAGLLRQVLGVAVAAGAAVVTGAGCRGDALFTARVLGRKDVASTRWLKLQTIEYVDQDGKTRLWDVCTRTTRAASMSASGVDAVVVLARLRSRAAPDQVDTLLVQQFRPPMGCVTIELPAGLVDKGESPEQAALRELKEETGYVGKAVACSAAICMSPGLTDEAVRIVTVDVDLDAAENANPSQELEETEHITVRRVPLRTLGAELRKMEAQGAMAIEGLHLLAVGLEMGSSFGH